MNTYVDEETGEVRSYVQARPRGEPELVEVFDRSPSAIASQPDTEYIVDTRGYWHKQRPGLARKNWKTVRGGTFVNYTRVWMAATPPSGLEPGYACVVGEVFDGALRSQERPLYLLDEASDVILPRLFNKIAALKDIYRPSQLYVDPKHEQFRSDLIKMRWGIAGYPAEDEVRDDELRAQHPHFVSRERIASPVDPPYKEDDEWGFLVVDTLFSEGRLTHHECCEVFAESQFQSPHRALAIVCLSMMSYEWTEQLNDMRDMDGYESVDDEMDEDAVDELEVANSKVVSMLYMVGDQMDRRSIERDNWRVYSKPDPEQDQYVPDLEDEKKDMTWITAT